MSQFEHWLALARWTPLVVLSDLDGTLIPFAPTPEAARPDTELLHLLSELASTPGVTAAIVSGRPRETLETYFESCPGLYLVAEHGGWRRAEGAWEPAAQAEPDEVESLTVELRRVAAKYPGALVERKTWSVAFHVRAISSVLRDAAVVEVENRIQSWLEQHPQFQELRGSLVLEVRPARMDKSQAVAWLRQRSGDRCRVVALGDDITDEDTFASLGPEDESLIVGMELDRATAAQFRLPGVADARNFLEWILRVRRGESDGALAVQPERVAYEPQAESTGESRFRLLVVSNRLPELRSASESFDVKKRNVGGLVSALEPVLRARRGVWLGWSGRVLANADATRFGLDESAAIKLAWVDLPEQWRRHYYNGFCNSALWPLLHSFLNRLHLSELDWRAYQDANAAFAASCTRLVSARDTIWLHDYHLLLLARALRQRGHSGPIGLFLHVPFPGPDVFFVLPWAEEILAALLDLDLIGFHTRAYAANFLQCAAALAGTRVGDDAVEFRGQRTRVGAFPIGIIPGEFQAEPPLEGTDEAANLMRAIAPSRLVLGVDRLDYTKGIPERLSAFSRLLELYPEWRRQVSLVQISVPSRGDVADYAEQRERVEQIVGRTNGDYGDADWVPVRYLYRAFDRAQLSRLYRSAAVGYVTPLRDGMNLVAKEYVAAQDPADPGVLLLSRFAGAAAELSDAVLTNPWYIDGLAHDLDRALRIAKAERIARHQKLLATVERTTAMSWAEDFLSALAQCGGTASSA